MFFPTFCGLTICFHSILLGYCPVCRMKIRGKRGFRNALPAGCPARKIHMCALFRSKRSGCSAFLRKARHSQRKRGSLGHIPHSLFPFSSKSPCLPPLFVESALRKRCGFAKRAISFSVLFYHEIPAKSTTFPEIKRISREFTILLIKCYNNFNCNYSVNFHVLSCEISENREIRPEIHIFPLLFGAKTGIITPLEDMRCNPAG